MSTEEDTELRDLVAQTLETNGVLNKIRAELRANVFLALEEQDAVNDANVSNKPLSDFLDTTEGHHAFSLVREFLQFFNLDFTSAVFEPESNYVGKSTPRENLKNELGLTKCDSKKPLLAELIGNKKGDALSISSSSSVSKRSSSKIPQRKNSAEDVKSKGSATPEKRSMASAADDIDNEDELLKELGVSPFNSGKKNSNTKPSWLAPEPAELSLENSPKKPLNLGSLKDAPPLPGLGGSKSINESPNLDVNSPEWDDLIKIDQKINELGFKLPTDEAKEKKGAKESASNRYSYDDDYFVGTGSLEKSDKLSITEEIEGDLSLGSFACSKADDMLTTDQTVSQLSGSGFDYGEEVEF